MIIPMQGPPFHGLRMPSGLGTSRLRCMVSASQGLQIPLSLSPSPSLTPLSSTSSPPAAEVGSSSTNCASSNCSASRQRLAARLRCMITPIIATPVVIVDATGTKNHDMARARTLMYQDGHGARRVRRTRDGLTRDRLTLHACRLTRDRLTLHACIEHFWSVLGRSGAIRN